MDNLLEAINEMILNEKETLSVLPQKSKKDIEEYTKKIQELSVKCKIIKKQIVHEIKSRYKKIVRKNIKDEVKLLEKNIKKYKRLFLLDEKSNSYEKMGLDIISYNLKHFYNNDLNLINENIYKCIKIFEECNIKLTYKDFNYNQYVNNYMSVFFEEMQNDLNNSEKLKKVFEDVYWKCPEIMKYINLNIYYLYYKNQKEIDKYYKSETNKLINEFGLRPDEIIKQFFDLKAEYYKKINQDESIILHKFIFEDYDINKYMDDVIKTEYSKLIKTDIETLDESELKMLNDNMYKLDNTLYEYKNYLKYVYILEEMKKKNTTVSKTEYTIDKDIKNIENEENKLMKINEKINKTNENKQSLFGKNDNINELIQKSNEQLNVLQDLYTKLEENSINTEIKKMFSENATIYQMLVFLSYHYSYFCDLYLKNKTEEEKKEINMQDELKQLKEFLSNPQFNVLIKNIKINDNNKIEQIIKDRYCLFNIEIQEEDLKEENLDDLIEIVNKIVLYNNIKNSEISVKDIKFMCELKKITQNK